MITVLPVIHFRHLASYFQALASSFGWANAPVDTCVLINHTLHTEKFACTNLAAKGQTVELSGVVNHVSHSAREGNHIASRECYAGAFYNFSQAADGRGDYQPPANHLFDGGKPGGLFAY